MRNFEKKLQISVGNLQSFGRLFFTPKQLYYEFCRDQTSPIGIKSKTAALFLGLSVIPTMFIAKQKPKSAMVFLTVSAVGLGTLAMFRRVPHTLSPPILWKEFEKKLSNYLQNQEIKNLLNIADKIDFTDTFPIDLTFYGLPRILVCESDEIAQMLRANQFHLETPCAVLSLREASPLNESFQKMLSNVQDSQVFFLHSASLKAYSIAQNLREVLQLKDEVPIRLLGLRPIHAKRLHLFANKTQNALLNTNLSTFDFLSNDEKKWLENGFTAEVSAVSPVRLMRVLRRIILGLEIEQRHWKIILPRRNLGFM
jgi:hypothetical protein